MEGSRKPRISVLMPAYNVEKYIAASLDSLLQQTYQDFEIVVVNDGSTDQNHVDYDVRFLEGDYASRDTYYMSTLSTIELIVR